MSTPVKQLESLIRKACLIEVRSIKPGNVSPSASFANASAADFERSANAIAPILANAAEDSTIGVGKAVLEAVSATSQAVGHNTNLGIILLLTPLARVTAEATLRNGIAEVLDNLTVEDATAVYRAIRIAKPGGLGEAVDQDVAGSPNTDLRTCMALAADRDLIAAQYVNNFENVLKDGVELLQQTANWKVDQEYRLAWVAVSLIAKFGDTLIRRKCGSEMDNTVRGMAQELLDSDWPFAKVTQKAYATFDEFLRADRNQRNPGTTADMIAAIVFAVLREGICTTDVDETRLIFPDDVR